MEYRLVPVEPTAEMLAVGAVHYLTNEYTGIDSTYRAMIAAAPQPVQEPVEFCTDYHCTGDCGKHGFGVQHAHPSPDQGAEIERLKAENTRLRIALANRSVFAKEASTLYALKEERLRAQEAELMCDTLREKVRMLNEVLVITAPVMDAHTGPSRLADRDALRGAALAAVKGEQT